ncbi:hypothetical protein ACIGPN_09155 [Streptomyces afghaniensis]|uniref:hypothetical protein n=1 Tax=Streptomyces TaxID=1883 RepID=UPI001427D9F2|nr:MULTISPECIES: hypothetical protein [Streptomyces]UOB10816.1 hypothetical protein MQE23_17810 [Streptomyces sp. HP-A2021]
MRTGKGDICGWLGRLLPTVALLVCLRSWPAAAAAIGVWPSVAAGVLRALRLPRGGGSLPRRCVAVLADVLLPSVFPYARPMPLVRRRTLRRAVTLCAGLCVSVVNGRR